MEIKMDTVEYHNYALIQGRLYYKGRLVLPTKSPWVMKLISEFHYTPQNGHFSLLNLSKVGPQFLLEGNDGMV